MAEYTKEVLRPDYHLILQREWALVDRAREQEGPAVPPSDLLRGSGVDAGLHEPIAVGIEGPRFEVSDEPPPSVNP